MGMGSSLTLVLLATPAIAFAAEDTGEVPQPTSDAIEAVAAPASTLKNELSAATSPAIEPELPAEESGISPAPVDVTAQAPIAETNFVDSEPNATPTQLEPAATAIDSVRLHGEPIAAVSEAAIDDPLAQMTEQQWQSVVNGATEAATEAVHPTITADADAILAVPQVEVTPAPADAVNAEPMPADSDPTAAMAQVTSVSQLSDVQPSDWAFQALQSLVERYGVIAGYPDGTFRGDRSLTRYEFAAALNAALDAINVRIAQGGEQPSLEDLQAIERLNADFQTELTSLNARVDRLEAQTAQLEAQQFSTTAILNGQTILSLAVAEGGDPPGRGEGTPVFNYLTLLQLAASFTGDDVLRVGLEAGNFRDRGFANPSSLNTNMALLNFQTDTDDRILLESLEYRFAPSDRLVVTVKPLGFSLSTVLSTNSLFTSAGSGAMSRFGAYSPVFRLGNLDSGVGIDWLVSDRARLQVAYGARDADDPSEGLFNSGHHALGVQLFVRPARTLTAGIAYVNAYSEDGRLDTFTGSNDADVSGGFGEPSTIHALNGTLQWEVTPGIVVGASGGVFGTISRRSDAGALSTTYQFSLGFPDPFGRDGDLLGIIVGQPPRLRAELASGAEPDDAIATHYEAFYRFRVNDNLSITPGFFWVTNPGHIADNNDIFIGALRTTFSF